MQPTASPRSGAARRPLELARNLVVGARTAAEHATDDPVVLALQVSRRWRSPLTDRAAAAGSRAWPGRDSVPGAVCRAVRGEDARLAADLEAAAGGALPPARAARLADVAIAAGDPVTGRLLLAGVPAGHAAAAGARARLAWHDGDFAGALAALDGAGGREARLRRRLASEVATFRGKRPELPRRPGYRPEPRRVLHLLTNSLPHTGSGYAQRSQSILAALREEGWDATAATRLGYPVQVGRFGARDAETVGGVTYRRLLPWRFAPGFDARLQQQAEAFARLVEELRPAVLHTTTHFVNALVVRAVAEAYGIPWVYEVRGQLADTWASTRSDEARDSERYRLFTEREAEAAAAASAVVTLGEAMRRRLLEQGLPAERIALCPNAVGEAFLAEPRPAGDAKRELGLDPALRYVGTVSSIVAYEGLDDLVEAFALLAPRHPDLRLLIAGDGVALPGLRLRARELGVADRVVFPGRVPREQSSLYHQALDVFTVPRKDLDVTRSVTPLKPVEASASARPVVASDLPALAELVHDGATGVLVAPGDPRSLAEGIGGLLADPERAATLGRAGREWVLGERTWPANARRYGELYRSLGAG